MHPTEYTRDARASIDCGGVLVHAAVRGAGTVVAANGTMNCMLRPFRVVFTRSAAPHAARIHVVFKELLGETRERTVALFFGELSAFVQSGALAGDHIHPASVAPHTEPAVISAVTATQSWHGLLLPLEAATCLLNMLEWLHHNEAPILEVQIAWDTPVLSAIATHVALPAAWPDRSFTLGIDVAPDARFQIEVRFRESQTTARLERVLHEVGAWFAAVNRGAYGDERCPPAACCLELTGEAIELGGDNLVMFVDRFCASPSALDGLANVIERVHHDLMPVERLTLA